MDLYMYLKMSFKLKTIKPLGCKRGGAGYY